MRTLNFIIFISVFILLYALVNYYLYARGSQSLPPDYPYRKIYTFAFILLSCSFFIGRTLENYYPSILSEVFVWIGSFWLAAMLYFFLAIVLCDFLRLLNFAFGIFPGWVILHYSKIKFIVGLSAVGCTAIVIFIGFLNARSPRLQKLEYTIAKPAATEDSVTLVVASDIHLGTIIGRKRFDALVEKINALKPDIVLFAGDFVDEDLAPVIRDDIGQALLNIKAHYGMYAITGNHEYIGGVEEACRYLTAHKVIMLRDTAVKINNSFYLIGREDQMIGRFAGKKRKPLEEIMRDVDKSYPLILMDHEPFHLEQAEQNGIDLQLSGHTHHGQLWPLNYITEQVYEKSWGALRRGNTNYYVSSGVGTWGPPVRIGNVPEFLYITLHFSHPEGRQ